MKSNSRRTKPAKRKQTSLDSNYRRVCQFQTTLLNQMALIRLDIVKERQADRALLRTITDHAARLLREKETLQKQLAVRDAPNPAVTKYYESMGWLKIMPKEPAP